MRDVQDATRQLFADLAEGRGGFDAVWSADLMYDGERRLSNVAIGEPDLSWDLGRFVVASGSVPLVWSDVFGSSMIPRRIGDWFSPFGAELQIDVVISAGKYQDRIPMGRFIIDAVPDAEDRRMLFDGQPFTAGESFKLEVSDRLTKVARDEFRVPTRATSTSAWQEVQALTGFPILKSVPDAVVPSGMAYEGAKEPIVNKVFDLMNAWPHLTPDGVLTALSKAWGDPVDTIRGRVSSPISMTADNTYNSVVVEGKGDDGEPIFAFAEIVEGILRVVNPGGGVSPFGSRTFRYASEFLRTYDQCANYARTLLQRVSKLRGVRRTIVEPFNLLREVGDVVIDASDGATGRITQVKHRGAETTSVLDIPDE